LFKKGKIGNQESSENLSVIAEEETYQSSNSFNKLKSGENYEDTKIDGLRKYAEKNSYENLRSLYQKSLSQSITEYDEINSNSANLTSSNEQTMTDKLTILDKLGLYDDTEEDEGEDDTNIQIVYI